MIDLQLIVVLIKVVFFGENDINLDNLVIILDGCL